MTAVPTCAGEQASAGQGDTLNLALAPSGEELTRALPRHPGEGLGAQGTAGVRRGRVWGLLTRTTSRGPPTPPPPRAHSRPALLSLVERQLAHLTIQESQP